MIMVGVDEVLPYDRGAPMAELDTILFIVKDVVVFNYASLAVARDAILLVIVNTVFSHDRFVAPGSHLDAGMIAEDVVVFDRARALTRKVQAQLIVPDAILADDLLATGVENDADLIAEDVVVVDRAFALVRHRDAAHMVAMDAISADDWIAARVDDYAILDIARDVIVFDHALALVHNA